MLPSLQPGADVDSPGSAERCAGFASAGFADPPDDWPAANPCDAAAVITREPKSRILARAFYSRTIDTKLSYVSDAKAVVLTAKINAD